MHIFLANILVFLHTILVIIILFGWAFPSFNLIYISALVLTLLSELILGYCPLTKWEFNLRKKQDPKLNYDYAFLSYYSYKIFGHRIPNNFIKYSALIFLATSIFIYFYGTFGK